MYWMIGQTKSNVFTVILRCPDITYESSYVGSVPAAPPLAGPGEGWEGCEAWQTKGERGRGSKFDEAAGWRTTLLASNPVQGDSSKQPQEEIVRLILYGSYWLKPDIY